MTLEFFFNALTYVWLAGEILIAVLTRTRAGEGKLLDQGTQIILWIVIVASLSTEKWMHDFFPIDMPGSFNWLRPMAFAILLLGLGIRATAVFNLASAFSANVAVRAGQQLQQSGLYSLVRHPSYLGLELIFLALALHSRTWACFAVAFVPPTLAVLYRIHVEETALRAAFGAEYEAYRRRTKRLIPGLY
jgi:protein-S-isoprenylcysteine O-methyltransferase Ste14